MNDIQDVQVDTLQSAWNHYKNTINCYHIGNDLIYFSFDFDEEGMINIIIPHFEIRKLETCILC
jgi:hypothetical protein